MLAVYNCRPTSLGLSILIIVGNEGVNDACLPGSDSTFHQETHLEHWALRTKNLPSFIFAIFHFSIVGLVSFESALMMTWE